MLALLFPSVIDNRFRGQWAGYWLLAPVLFLKFAIALGSILNPRQADAADAIDLSTYSQAALSGAALSTALLGLLHLCIGLLGLLAMIRYRAMVPMVHLWLIVEFLGRRVVLALHPIDRTGGASGASWINLTLVVLMAAGLALSLWPRREVRPTGGSPEA